MGIYADALFTKTQQRVLGILFGQPHRSFYAKEIIGLAAIGSGAVQRELARLTESGLVNVHRIGNQTHYQVNNAAPIYAALQEIVVRTFGATDVLGRALAPLWAQIDVAFVYGSLAKGTEHAGSDVDLMVVGNLPSNAVLLEALQDTQVQLGREVNPTWYMPDEFAQRVADGKSFIRRVLEQPKLFIKGAENDVLRLAGLSESGTHRSA